MKRGTIIVTCIILLSFISGFFSCTFHSEEELYGIEDCDTTVVTWDDPIREILATYCVECHNEDLNYSGVRHDVYELELIVVNDGRLNGVVNHLPGYPQMPYQRPKLPDCELLLINTWLERGAPEN
jgi:hypothetical protein